MHISIALQGLLLLLPVLFRDLGSKLESFLSFLKRCKFSFDSYRNKTLAPSVTINRNEFERCQDRLWEKQGTACLLWFLYRQKLSGRYHLAEVKGARFLAETAGRLLLAIVLAVSYNVGDIRARFTTAVTCRGSDGFYRWQVRNMLDVAVTWYSPDAVCGKTLNMRSAASFHNNEWIAAVKELLADVARWDSWSASALRRYLLVNSSLIQHVSQWIHIY